MAPSSPFTRFLDAQGFAVLDGGLATTLEARGHSLDTALWSAALLRDAPEDVRAVHDAFLVAGADCISTSSYQASLPGFARLGIDAAEGAALLRRSVELATDARDAFWTGRPRPVGRLEPLIAASIGPYGAYLADGSEYDGRYGLDGGVGREALAAFHRPRLQILADTPVDLLAIETLPSLPEAEVLVELLGAVAHPGAWVSFSCRDGRHLWDGSRIEDAVEACVPEAGVVAVGVNCTAPTHVMDLLRRMRDATDLPILAYPNSGETYDASGGTWSRPEASTDESDRVQQWVGAGARILGGCCRAGPEEIAAIRMRLEMAIAASMDRAEENGVGDAP